jgi:hypothetical protein
MSQGVAVPCAASADDMLIFVASGAGKHFCFIPTFGSTQAIIRPLAPKDCTPAAAIEAFQQG